MANEPNLTTALLAFITAFVTALFAEPLRKFFFKPNLELDFKNNQDFKTLTPTQSDSKAYYIRVCVRNKSWYPALGCRAHLVSIERKNVKGEFERTDFVDTLRLAWSCQPENESYRPIDIPQNVNQFFDVVVTYPSFMKQRGTETFEEMLSGDFKSNFKLLTQITPLRYKELENQVGEYRYTIWVTADGVKPISIKLIFKWTNNWQKFEVSKG